MKASGGSPSYAFWSAYALAQRMQWGALRLSRTSAHLRSFATMPNSAVTMRVQRAARPSRLVDAGPRPLKGRDRRGGAAGHGKGQHRAEKPAGGQIPGHRLRLRNTVAVNTSRLDPQNAAQMRKRPRLAMRGLLLTAAFRILRLRRGVDSKTPITSMRSGLGPAFLSQDGTGKAARHSSAMPRTPIYAKWSEAEDETLTRLWATASTISGIARRMRRSPDTVRMKAAKLGLPSKDDPKGRRKQPAQI